MLSRGHWQLVGTYTDAWWSAGISTKRSRAISRLEATPFCHSTEDGETPRLLVGY